LCCAECCEKRKREATAYLQQQQLHSFCLRAFFALRFTTFFFAFPFVFVFLAVFFAIFLTL